MNSSSSKLRFPGSGHELQGMVLFASYQVCSHRYCYHPFRQAFN